MARASAIAMAEGEGPPEADRLDGFLHPRDCHDLFGHGQAEARLGDALQRGRLHHAWLFTGPEGIGKAVLAYRFARFLLANEAEREHSSGPGLGVAAETIAARQISRQAHPNLLVVRRPWNLQRKRFATAIPVDEVRRLRNFLGLTAAGGNWRIIIVDRADELNRNAANALLKALEEPPEKCIFFLISATAGRLLPTIRSRCQRLELHVLGADDLRAAMVSACRAVDIAPPDAQDFDRLALLSGGSVRRGLELISGEGLELYKQLIGILETLPRADYVKIHALAERISAPAADAQWEMFHSLLDETLRRFVRVGAGVTPGEGQEADLVNRLAIKSHLAVWAGLWETITRERAEALALNLDRKSLILGIFQKLESAAHFPGSR